MRTELFEGHGSDQDNFKPLKKGHVNGVSEMNFKNLTLPRAANSKESLRAKAV